MIDGKVNEIPSTLHICHFCLYHMTIFLFNKAFVGLPHAITILKVFGSHFQTARSYDVISELKRLRLPAFIICKEEEKSVKYRMKSQV